MKKVFFFLFLFLLTSPSVVFAETTTILQKCICEFQEVGALDSVRETFTGAEWLVETSTDLQAVCQNFCQVKSETYGFSLVSSTYTPEDNTTFTAIKPVLGVSIPGFTGFQDPIKIDGVLQIGFIGEYISAVYNWLIGVMAVFAVIMIMVGGIRYMLAGGSKEGVKQATDHITHALIGMVLLLGSYLILYTTNPQLTLLGPISIEAVARAVVERSIVENLAQCADVKATVPACGISVLKKPSGWTDTLTDIVNNVAEDTGVDPILLATHLQKETSGTITYSGKRGPCGEIGPSQLMATTYDAVVGSGGRCCTAIARKNGITQNDKDACAITTTWPPDPAIIPDCNVNICGNCQTAALSCADYFDTSTSNGLENSVDAAARLIKQNLGRKDVDGDIALELCAYNGSGKQAAEYAESAGEIYTTFCNQSK